MSKVLTLAEILGALAIYNCGRGGEAARNLLQYHVRDCPQCRAAVDVVKAGGSTPDTVCDQGRRILVAGVARLKAL